MSSLSTFLEAKKIKPAALLAASNRLETAAPAEGAKKPSGSGLTKKQLDAALAGKALTRRARAKAVRAAALLLAKAKEPAPSLKELFGEDPVRKGKKKAVAAKK